MFDSYKKPRTKPGVPVKSYPRKILQGEGNIILGKSNPPVQQ